MLFAIAKGFAFLATVLGGMNDQELLTATQAADALSATSQTIRNWIRSGRLPAVRIGNRFLIPRVEIDRVRGEVPAVAAGEGVWESDEDAPAVALPRAAERGRVPGSGANEGLLGT